MKNPWMSLWLSAANRAAGTARGHWMAEAQRQQAAATRAALQAAGLAPKPKRKQASRRKAR